MMTAAQTAYQFGALGVAAIPVRPRDKKPALNAWRDYQKRLPTPAQLLSWFDGKNEQNVGVITGWQGLTVLDFDEIATYRKWLWWAQRQGRLTTAAHVAAAAYRVSTSRGVHVYIWLAEPERNRHLPGIDIKGRGGYVLGEGSIHPTGALYKALTPHMVIPHVGVLADVLPPALLMQQDQPDSVAPLPQPTKPAGDPWLTAANAAVVSSDLVARIKSTLRIQDLFANTEQTSGDGRWLRACCPLHDDRHPSFWIDTQLQIGGCFAGCTRKPLDVIDLFGRMYGLSNRDAIYELGRRL